MSKQDNGGQAFPTVIVFTDGAGDVNSRSESGMTLRDYFAAKAMHAMLSALLNGIRPNDCTKTAEDAYFVADAMLKARQP